MFVSPFNIVAIHLRICIWMEFQIDPDEERKILAKEKKASMEHSSNTLKRHTLVLKKRDLMRKKAEEEKKKVIKQLLAAEGLELDTDDESQQNILDPPCIYIFLCINERKGRICI